jgi:chromatin remodeling complex protein RSC6
MPILIGKNRADVLPFVHSRATSQEANEARASHIEGAEMAKKTAKKSARKPNAAFMKPMTPSASLAEVVGSKPIPRTEVTKKLWAYIKKNKLQDAKNRRMIKADDALKTVFGGKATVNMFEMTKLVNKHLKA